MQGTELGEGIIFYDGDDEVTIASLQSRYNFLDHLWLPSSLGKLTASQIFVINRFREERRKQDGQFLQADRSRAALKVVLSQLNIQSLLEIGCGKFPISNEMHIPQYRGIDIDPEAIEHCRQHQLDVGTLAQFAGADDARFAAAVSLYVFHFAIERALVDYLDDHLDQSACLIFNMIVEEGVDIGTKLALLSQSFAFVRVLKPERAARREFFFLISRQSNAEHAAHAARLLAGALDCPCP